ncbi:FAD-binding oxidoreductase [Actinomadura rayongensis]|uniref:FAD-binding protein n=1 Tax=Actinomadura rayongensis TaxID=1429076 RepID=A0A6I4W5R7_9ACTN|nr:FAD-binding oxidoreductase [Actinomadura rayongensis]MXQ63675.1 FAD-binding protein [Actinomadura rayongensis]
MDALDALAGACADVRPAEPEEGVLGVAPRYVAAPATVEEASALLRAAAGHGLAMVARGGETRLDWGPPPTRCDLLVDTRRLDRIVEHAAGDLVATAEAGVPLDDLNAALGAHGQRLALDGPPGSTVGGTVAAGAAGPLRLRYGTPRDLVIGLTIVRADGTVARSGGKVVKNVAGYDLGRLFAGSFGTLGLIVSATFRLHPLPPARAFVSQTYGSAAEAYDAVHAVLHSQADAAAIECATAPGAGHRVDVLLEGVAEALPARSDRVASLIGGTVAEQAPDGWGAYPDGSALIETSVPPASLKDLLTGPHAATAALTWSASGHGWAALPAGTPPERVAEVLAALRSIGGAVVRFAPEDVRAAVDVWGPVPALALMRRVKDQFDPEHRLSPGRFAGGI